MKYVITHKSLRGHIRENETSEIFVYTFHSQLAKLVRGKTEGAPQGELQKAEIVTNQNTIFIDKLDFSLQKHPKVNTHIT